VRRNTIVRRERNGRVRALAWRCTKEMTEEVEEEGDVRGEEEGEVGEENEQVGKRKRKRRRVRASDDNSMQLRQSHVLSIPATLSARLC